MSGPPIECVRCSTRRQNAAKPLTSIHGIRDLYRYSPLCLWCGDQSEAWFFYTVYCIQRSQSKRRNLAKRRARIQRRGYA
jgi:hypothetical protein